MSYFNYLDLKFDELNAQINTYLQTTYNIPAEKLSSASPFGQIAALVKEIYQMVVLYQKNTLRNFVVDEVDNEKMIRNLAQISGHVSTRAISASGVIHLKLKPGIDINSQVSGGQIIVSDKTKIKNNTNGLIYTIVLGGKQSDTYNLTATSDIYLSIIQGSFENQSFTGNGQINQSFNVNTNVSNTIENFHIYVTYNNQFISIKDSIFDMGLNEYACVIHNTQAGISVLFGNGDYGVVPAEGTLVKIEYLLSDGTDGIILTPQANDFQFLDDINDMSNQPINVPSVFDILVDNPISFASNGESIAFTQSLLPYVSRNFVLATSNNYIYWLKRLSMFSIVNAYTSLNPNGQEGDNKVYLFLVPQISNFFTGNINYFNVPLSAFQISKIDQEKVLTYLRRSANIPTNTVLTIIQPTLSLYVINIYVRQLSGYSQDTVTQGIISTASTFLTNWGRDDRIVKSELINTIQSLEYVDSCNVTFISKKNEDYHKLNSGSTQIFGLDPIFGEPVANPDELCIIRGGWSDRNGSYYQPQIQNNAPCSINVFIVGTQQKNLNT